MQTMAMSPDWWPRASLMVLKSSMSQRASTMFVSLLSSRILSSR